MVAGGNGINDRYRALVEDGPSALIIIDEHRQIALVNSEVERMFGYQRVDLLGQNYEVLLADRSKNTHDSGPVHSSGLAMFHGGDDLEYYARRKDSTEFPVEITVSILAGNEVAATFRDVSDSKRNEAEFRTALSLLSATLESTADGILVVTDTGKIRAFNERFRSMWGISAQLMASQDDDKILSFVLDKLVDPTGFVAKVQELYHDPDAESTDILEFRDGRTFERYSRPQRVAQVVVGRVWSFRDATPRRRAEDQAREALAELAERAEQLKVLAFRDQLTGLANRVLLHDRLDHALAASKPSNVCLLLLDLDNFKEVNDVLGHQAGDQLLIEVGKRLRECVRASDTVARVGGDEFIILLEGDRDSDAVARRVVVSLNMPIHIDGKELRPSASVGLSSIDDGLVLGSELMRHADIAMYAAKTAGKNRFVRFRPEMMTALLARANMKESLRHAVDGHEIIVHFQPILAAKEGSMTQVEALVRWQGPDELVAPLDFIPVAESTGLINDIGHEVLAQSCRQLRAWLGESELNSVAVNVSGVQLLEVDFAQRVIDEIARNEVRAQQVVLEVTESVFLSPSWRIIDQLTLLRGRGIRVAVDDFGTGYSSLARLQDLPIDALKVDMTFVESIRTVTESLPILSSIIDMAHNLGLHVTAEGVETDTQAARLLDLGCDALQGFLFAKPQAVEDLPRAEELSIETMRRIRSVRGLPT